MFKINANPTFDAPLTIIGQGREQKLNVTFRHKTRTEYIALLEAVQKGDTKPADAILQIVEKWDADAELNAQSIETLIDQQPGIDAAILTGYGDALMVSARKN